MFRFKNITCIVIIFYIFPSKIWQNQKKYIIPSDFRGVAQPGRAIPKKGMFGGSNPSTATNFMLEYDWLPSSFALTKIFWFTDQKIKTRAHHSSGFFFVYLFCIFFKIFTTSYLVIFWLGKNLFSFRIKKLLFSAYSTYLTYHSHQEISQIFLL